VIKARSRSAEEERHAEAILGMDIRGFTQVSEIAVEILGERV
jgi:hypothetical protein